MSYQSKCQRTKTNENNLKSYFYIFILLLFANREKETRPVELQSKVNYSRITNGSFTTTVSISFLSLYETSDSCRFGISLSDFRFYTANGILCVLIEIASLRRS